MRAADHVKAVEEIAKLLADPITGRRADNAVPDIDDTTNRCLSREASVQGAHPGNGACFRVPAWTAHDDAGIGAAERLTHGEPARDIGADAVVGELSDQAVACGGDSRGASRGNIATIAQQVGDGAFLRIRRVVGPVGTQDEIVAVGQLLHAAGTEASAAGGAREAVGAADDADVVRRTRDEAGDTGHPGHRTDLAEYCSIPVVETPFARVHDVVTVGQYRDETADAVTPG